MGPCSDISHRHESPCLFAASSGWNLTSLLRCKRALLVAASAGSVQGSTELSRTVVQGLQFGSLLTGIVLGVNHAEMFAVQ